MDSKTKMLHKKISFMNFEKKDLNFKCILSLNSLIYIFTEKCLCISVCKFHF